MKIADLSTDFYQSRLRNKLIAEAFYLTKNIEKYGSGFIRIRKEMEKYPNFSFLSEEIGGGVLLTFSFGGVNDEIGGVNEESSSLYEILNFIKLNPGSNTTEMVHSLNVPKRTIERLVKQLKVENKIEFKGSPKKGGYFTLEPEKS